MKDITKTFGELVFSDEEMLKRLGAKTYKQYRDSLKDDQKEIISIELANKIADVMKKWAIEKGATHYTHWFQPLSGYSAEKHESFIEPQESGKVLMKFSGKELIKGEADGSSFPSGGLRSTFEARGYTAWDASSHAFVRNETLYIPTIFMSYYGQILDKKLSVHRSSTALKKQTLRFVQLFGHHANHARVTVGAEQEYFLIDKQMFDKRLDLKLTGRTLFGARSPKCQELEDHYYGQIKTRVMSFMHDLDFELWRLGIPAKTRHNEVAPCQHELAPMFERVSVAIDHNQLLMEIMKKTAEKHGLVCLLHEKPFAEMNGSGKHNNWSISVDGIGNMLSPGADPENNLMFLLYVACIMAAVDTYQDLIRISVATAGNEHRLGGNEAPPAIITIFLGEYITGILQRIASEGKHKQKQASRVSTSVKFIAEFERDASDRNRTSPFAFTGNKFEFRMPGSSTHLSSVNTIINVAVADILQQVTDQLSKVKDKKQVIKNKIKELFNKHQRILFNGNGYSKDWEKEAHKRGLLNLKTVPEALSLLNLPKNVALFKRHGIYTEEEINAQQTILFEEYCKLIKIESLTMLDMLNREILPATLSFENQLIKNVLDKKQIKIDVSVETKLLRETSSLLQHTIKTKDQLLNALSEVRNHKTLQDKAFAYRQKVFACMVKIREHVDQLERIIPKHLWPFPTYADILFH